MDFAPLIEKKAERFRELDAAISAPDFYANPQAAKDVMREHTRLKSLLALWHVFQKTGIELRENREFAAGDDAEMAEMAQAEIPQLEERLAKTEQEIQVALLPPDANDDRDAIVEIRAGTGGNEAAIFAADLYRMYLRYSEAAGLKIEQMESSPADLGGVREVIFKMSGDSVFRRMRYESGVHRVQRVPATEAQGRIHTSTATVAVLRRPRKWTSN
jgi:peptide chain release factor 1